MDFPDLRPDWDSRSQFRRYVYFPRPLEAGVSTLISRVLWAERAQLRPYLTWKRGEDGVVLVPRSAELEKLIIVPGIDVTFVRTSRDPEHDAAVVRALTLVNGVLRSEEQARKLDPHSLGHTLCDDCGVHPRHRSRRLMKPGFPAQDGSVCAPWKGAHYNVTYG